MNDSPDSPKRALRFGFSTLGCPELDAAGVRALAARHRCQYVEIRTLGGSMDFVGELAKFPGGAAGVRDFFLESGVRVCAVGASLQLTRAGVDARAGLIAEAETAEALGAKWMRVFGGGQWGDALTPEAAAKARAHREWWAALRAARGWRVDLMMEVHDAFSGSPQVLEFFERTGGPMPLLWDTHHTWKIGGESATETWSKLGSHVVHVHVKDSVAGADGSYTYVAPGSGEFPLAATLAYLIEVGYGGVVSLEWEKKWHPKLAELETILPDWDRAIAAFQPRSGAPTSAGTPTLLYRSDFDRARIGPASGPYFHGGRGQYEDLESVGPTSCPPGLGEPTPDNPRLGKLRIYYEGGDATQRSAMLVPDPADPQNQVLRFRLAEPNVELVWPNGERQRKSRVQAEVYGNIELRDFYQTVRLRLGAEAAQLRDFPGKVTWFTLMEFWNNAGWTDEPDTFRFGFHLIKTDRAPGSDFYFASAAQTQSSEKGFEDVWDVVNREVPVPFGTWLKLELYFREGDERTGRFYAAVTPAGGARVVLFDVRNWTHHPQNTAPTGLKQACPLKLYTAADTVDFLRARGVALEVDWDDLEIWRGRLPPEDARA